MKIHICVVAVIFRWPELEVTKVRHTI